MGRILIELGKWGCDVDMTMERMLGDEEFYIECLNTITEDPNFEALKKALEEQNISAAFDIAHTMKGVIANLGLTPIYNKIVEIVEPLRGGKGDNLTVKLEELETMRTHLAQILQQS